MAVALTDPERGGSVTRWRPRVVLAGLPGDRRFGYRVEQGDEAFTASFCTAPARTLTPIRFLVWADPEAEPASVGRLGSGAPPGYPMDQDQGLRAGVRAGLALDADFILHAGDLVEQGGRLSNWDMLWQRLNDPVDGPLAANVPLVAVPGNHDNYGQGLRPAGQPQGLTMPAIETHQRTHNCNRAEARSQAQVPIPNRASARWSAAAMPPRSAMSCPTARRRPLAALTLLATLLLLAPVPGQAASPPQRSTARYLRASDALTRLADADADTVLVDLRRPVEVAELRIPGALDIPAHQVRTKGFLRDKRVLLLDAAHRYRDVERTAAALADAGFAEVTIVEGGLGAWQAAGGALLGPAAPGRLHLIPPTEVAAEAAFPHWRVVLIRAGSDQTETLPPIDPLPGARSADAAALPPALGLQRLLDAPAARLAPDALNALPALFATLVAPPVTPLIASLDAPLAGPPTDDGLAPLVLLVAIDHLHPARLLAPFGDAAPRNLFVLEGGLPAAQAELQRLAALRARALAPPPRPGACGG